MSSLSIRLRLTLWYSAVLAGGLILFSGTVWISLRHLLLADLTSSLQHQMQGLAQYLRIEDGDAHTHFAHLAHEVDEYSQSMGIDHRLEIYAPDGALLYSNGPSVKTGELRSAQRSVGAGPHAFNLHDVPYVGMDGTFDLQAGTYSVFLALPSAPVLHTIRLLGLLLLGFVPLFVSCGAAGGYWLSRRALAPVDHMTEKALTIGLESLSERLPVPQTKDELQRLAETWNEMLSRIATAVNRISQFTADASHELRTPVAIIRLAAEKALRKVRTETEYRETLIHIQHQSENMTRLIEDLLFLARCDLEKAQPQSELVNIADLVREVCADWERLAAARQLELCFEPQSTLPHVCGTSSGIRQMLAVLLDNAIKYTPPGGRVSVGLEQNGPLVVLFVDDNGIGIPEQARPYIFERFFRVDPSRSKGSGGFGLGLALARRIAEQNSASIELQAKSAGGCRFCISLPAAA